MKWNYPYQLLDEGLLAKKEALKGKEARRDIDERYVDQGFAEGGHTYFCRSIYPLQSTQKFFFQLETFANRYYLLLPKSFSTFLGRSLGR